MEVLGVLAAATRWQLLLLLFVVDVAFLLTSSLMTSQSRGEAMVKQVMEVQDKVRAELAESRRGLHQLMLEALAEDRLGTLTDAQLASHLGAHVAAQAEARLEAQRHRALQRNQTLELLARGISDLERQIRRLEGEAGGG